MPRRWEGETVTILGCGPSLTEADIDTVTDSPCRIIAVNDAWKLCPVADVLYAADADWWKEPGKAPKSSQEFAGERWTTQRGWSGQNPAKLYSINILLTRGGSDVSNCEPVCDGKNSAFQAMGMAVIWGARRIVFLGLDLMPEGDTGKTHFFGSHPTPLRDSSPYNLFRDAFDAAAPQLVAMGVTVINASRATALTCFPRMDIADALS